MSRSRSPNYPNIGLPQAIQSTQALWDREGRTPVDSETAVRAWGYSSLSGPARSRIAALRQYGLLEETEDGIRVSGLGLEIIQHPEGSEERRAAIAGAALAPDLFRELSKTHLRASDDALKAYLVTKRQFTDDGAKQFIRAFRETMDLVKLEESDYSSGEEGPRREPRSMPDSLLLSPDEQRKLSGLGVAKGFSVPVSGSLIAEVRFIGEGDPTPEDVDTLAGYLSFIRQAISRKGSDKAPVVESGKGNAPIPNESAGG